MGMSYHEVMRQARTLPAGQLASRVRELVSG
jgi:hypothetical protein